MDTCHILLGRPWQYDQRTKHDGFLNTYSFKKDGVNIVLAPLDTRDNPIDNLFLSKGDIRGLTKLTPQTLMYALVVIDENKQAPPIPKLIQPLIEEFQGVFLSDIPSALPLMREIQHCIDFLPDSTIPNKPAYRINPKEFEELHRQVNELLEKGDNTGEYESVCHSRLVSSETRRNFSHVHR